MLRSMGYICMNVSVACSAAARTVVNKHGLFKGNNESTRIKTRNYFVKYQYHVKMLLNYGRAKQRL